MSASTMAEEKIYTVNEVAEILRVTPRTVRRMIADGQIDYFKVRDEYRIRQSAIDALKQRREKQE